MNKKSFILIFCLALMCLFPKIEKVNAFEVKDNVVFAIQTRWVYRKIGSVTYKRLLNITENKWMTNWIKMD